MPELPDRMDREQALQTAIGPVFARQAERVKADAEQRDQVDWEPFAAALALAMLPRLQSTYETSGTLLANRFGVDAAAGLQRSDWADLRSRELALGVVETSQHRLELATARIGLEIEVEQARRKRAGLDPLGPAALALIANQLLAARIDLMFGPQRAEVIATTETTGAITAGENASGGFLKTAMALAAAAVGISAAADIAIVLKTLQGEEEKTALETFGEDAIKQAADKLKRHDKETLVKVWFTRLDERVCHICAPLHGAQESQWNRILRANGFPGTALLVAEQGGPTAHPNCRCRVSWIFKRQQIAA